MNNFQFEGEEVQLWQDLDGLNILFMALSSYRTKCKENGQLLKYSKCTKMLDYIIDADEALFNHVEEMQREYIGRTIDANDAVYAAYDRGAYGNN